MSKADAAKTQPDDADKGTSITTPSTSKRGVSQATLSIVGDISVAATGSIGRTAPAPGAARWLLLLGFFLLVYVATCLVTLFSFKRDPWVRAFLTPLFSVLVATAAFGWSQRWKFRAKSESFKLKVRQNALGSLSHEASSAANAVRANLTGFRLAHPQAAQSEFLSAIELATARIDKALQKSNGLLALQDKEGTGSV
jgi:hypothetical protein